MSNNNSTGQIRSLRQENKAKKGAAPGTGRQLSPARKKIIAIVCIAAAVLLAVFGILWHFVICFSPAVADMHTPLNSLPERLEFTAALKDGALYLCRGDSSVLIDENIYSPDDTDSLSAVSYWLDQDGTLIYLRDYNGERALMRCKDGQKTFLMRNVSSWRISPDGKRLAAVIGAGSGGIGSLVLTDTNGGEFKLLSTGIRSESAYFSGDSSSLFAVAANGTKGEVHIYRSDGEKTVSDVNALSLGWLSQNGESFLCVNTSSVSGLYSYTFCTVSGKRLAFSGVAYSQFSPDGSVAYLLHDYSTSEQSGTLTAVDTKTLRTHRIAQNVYGANHTAVTDTARGIVYSAAGSQSGRCDIYYFDLARLKSLSLAKDTYTSVIGNIVIDCAQQKGYMLLRSSSTQNTQLYFVDVSGSGAKTEKLRDGAMYEIMYYEACGRLLFSANADKTATELWCVDARGNSSKLINNCGAIYDSSSSAYYSCSMMSNDGNHLIYFKDVTVIAETDDDPFSSHPTAKVYGTLMLYRLSDSKLRVIAKNVRADTFACVPSDGNAQSIFYSVVKTNGKYDIFRYDTALDKSFLLLENADMLAEDY